MTGKLRVLILGGAGTFGSRTADLLKAESGLELILAGRKLRRLSALSRKLNAGGAKSKAVAINLARDDLAQLLQTEQVDLVIHTAGPFQTQNYDVQRACLRAGADLIDLADSSSYVSRIRRFDAEAKKAGVAIISGASTVPALSSAVVDEVAGDFASIRAITTRITPGNRAPRGRAVVAAILSYVGKPIPGWEDGFPVTVIGWSQLHRCTLRVSGIAPLRRRWLAACEAPDLILFPEHYAGVKDVRFFAGLQLSVLHLGLWLLSWFPRSGMVRSLRPLAGPLRFIAGLLRPLGSDRGGMTVEVEGRTQDGQAVRRRWTMIAEAGHGPFVPCLASVALVRRRLRGEPLEPGASPCVGLISLPEFEAAMVGLRIRMDLEQETVPLYQRALGDAYARLPAPIREMHDLDETMLAIGEASVRCGSTILAALVARLFGFPPTNERTQVEVTLTPKDGKEIWKRRFGITKFESTQYLSKRRSQIIEQFGLFSFSLDVEASASGLRLLPRSAWLGALPLPRAVVRRIAASERVAEDGRFEFDATIAFPVIGELIHYRGRLSPPQKL